MSLIKQKINFFVVFDIDLMIVIFHGGQKRVTEQTLY